MFAIDITGSGLHKAGYKSYFDNDLSTNVYYKLPIFKPFVEFETKPVKGKHESNTLYKLLSDYQNEFAKKFNYTNSYFTNNFNNITRCIYQMQSVKYDLLIKRFAFSIENVANNVDEKSLITFADTVLQNMKTDKIAIYLFANDNYLDFLHSMKVIGDKHKHQIDEIINVISAVGLKHDRTETPFGYVTIMHFTK